MKSSVAIFVWLIFAACIACQPARSRAADQIIFPHATHFAEDIDCLSCHEGIAASQGTGERYLPEMEFCADCHDVDDEANCRMCHTNSDDAGDRAPRAYGASIFSHSAHVGQGMGCADCHGDPASISEDEMPRVPAKADCRICHTTADDYADCGMCHTDPARPVPVMHGGDWSTGHGLPAQSDPARCYQCHTESGCQECHSGDNVRPRSHGLNFGFGHAMAARGNEMECAICHTEPEYCSSCHVAERVMPRSHSSAGWANTSDGGRHALDAPFEMENCIACHSAGGDSPSCAACHGG